MADISLLALFLIGFLGGSHCVGMCGGLSSAFVLQLPPNMRRWQLILCLNTGRLLSYVFIGVALGALSQYGISLDQTRSLQTGLLIVANVLLILLGLYLGGWTAWITQIERLGKPVWRRLNPLLSRLLPLKSWPASLAVGALWGWLPCGMVYSASLYALSSGSALQGGLSMAAFGLGTLPNLLAMGLFASRLKGWLQRRSVRLVAGLSVALWALWQLYRLLSGGLH